MRLISANVGFSPSDLNNFLECRHLTQLNLAIAKGEVAIEEATDEYGAWIARKGDEHEAAYLKSMKDAGKQVVEIPDASSLEGGSEVAASLTIDAMRAGAEVIYQGGFVNDGWTGYADFLLRADQPSDLGAWSYEAADTKLARRTKPYFLLQLCFYSEQIGRIQGRMPEFMHVILGTNEQQRFRIAEFYAYYRRIRERFVNEVARSPLPTYPNPVPHCRLCRWSDHCDAQRVADDHLSLVAGMRNDQVLRLNDVGVTTLTQLAELPSTTKPPTRMLETAFQNLRLQAELQLDERQTGVHSYALLEPEEKRGFALLPPPSEGDVFFDIEGDPLYENGLEYLFGVVYFEDGEQPFRPFWGHDRAQEKLAFEQFIDFVTERRKRYPDLHVYHYSHYETTALKRLMGLHGTREDEVDDLLREGVMVDLYKVVRQAMRISLPGYGIKKIEAFYMEQRDTSVTEGGQSILVYEKWLETQEQRLLDEIAEYNEDDCVSTLKLRDWLLGLRTEAEEKYRRPIEWRAPEAREQTEERVEADAQTQRLQESLLAGVPDDPAARTDEQQGRWLMAQLLEYHRRDEKPVWWAYFERCGMSPEELVEDAESIGELTVDPDFPPEPDKKSLVHEFRFPPQQHRLRPGDAIDPATGKDAGEIVSLEDGLGRLRLRRGPGLADIPLPRALIPGKPYNTRAQREALRRLAGETGSYRALWDVLLRAYPRIAGLAPGEPLQAGSIEIEQMRRLALGLDHSYLFIQGPPGSGKTWTGARLITELIRAGKRVGVTAQSHKAIHNLLEEVEEAAREEGLQFKGLKKSTGDPDSVFDGDFIESSSDGAAFPPPDDVQLVAGTAWLFPRPEMDRQLDCLIIDEAGQVSLADALAVSTSARNLVLLGDPLQLAQVSQGVHPVGSGASVLEHLLGDEPTIPPKRGLFLDHTRRMHPDVCDFISEVVYAGRLHSIEGCERQTVDSRGLTGTGVRFVPVEHEGNQRSSPEEADAIAAEMSRMLDGGTWTDCDGVARDLTLDDILVVTPYNAQVRCLQEKLRHGARIGTVDKFQGQEAPVVFFSMATSSGEDIPRNLAFLFSRNRLNVAISRAQCLAVLVASPELLYARCRNVDQLRLVNALCRLVEVAEQTGATAPAPGEAAA